MVTIPAFVWRGEFVLRVLIIGGAVGFCLGVLAWLDSGFLLAGAIVLVVVGLFYGIWMARRMVRYWPGSKQLSGDERVTVVRAVRGGQPIDDAALAQPATDYSRALRAAAEEARHWRWLLVFVLVVAVGTTVWDAVYGSWGNAVASGIYLLALLIEVFWWPKRQRELLANADDAIPAETRPELE